LIEKLDGGKRVRAEEIEKMRGAADGCGFFRRYTAESEVMQLEGSRKDRRAHEALPMTCLMARESVATVMGYQTCRRRFSASLVSQ